MDNGTEIIDELLQCFDYGNDIESKLSQRSLVTREITEILDIDITKDCNIEQVSKHILSMMVFRSNEKY